MAIYFNALDGVIMYRGGWEEENDIANLGAVPLPVHHNIRSILHIKHSRIYANSF